MSFNDLERGNSPPPSAGLQGQSHLSSSSQRSSLRGSGGNRGPLPLYHAPPSSKTASQQQQQQRLMADSSSSDAEFKQLADRIGIQLFKLQSNVAGIEKLVDLQERALRTTASEDPKASRDWTKQVHDLTETTRALVKDLSTSIKTLSNDYPPNSSTLNSADKFTASRLQRDFETSINRFAQVQRRGAEVGRIALQGAREARERKAKSVALSTDENEVAIAEEGLAAAGSQEEQQQQQQQEQPLLQRQQQVDAGPSLAEIEFQEALIAERESEIREIEGGIHELNEIFRDLGHIVQEQGGMIDNIEYNVSSIATNTGAADRELVSAHEYQRKAGRRAACLLLIVGFVVAVVLLAVLN